jgi:hypothetical protein
MPTSARTQRSSTTQSSRFARSGAGRSSAPRPKVSRGATPQQRRRAVGIRRKPPQQSGMQKAFSALSGAVPGLGGKKKGSRSFGGKKSSTSVAGGKSGKAGGVALLTAAAGFAFSNRDKVSSMLRRKGSDQGSTPPVATDSPVTTGTSSPSVPPHA